MQGPKHLEITHLSVVVYLEEKKSHVFDKKERSMGELIDITIARDATCALDKKESVNFGIHDSFVN